MKATYSDPVTGEVLSRDRPHWDALIAPVNTLDLHGEDLIKNAKLAHIIETSMSRLLAPFNVPTVDLADRTKLLRT
jgi:hypothetical protein